MDKNYVFNRNRKVLGVKHLNYKKEANNKIRVKLM